MVFVCGVSVCMYITSIMKLQSQDQKKGNKAHDVV